MDHIQQGTPAPRPTNEPQLLTQLQNAMLSTDSTEHIAWFFKFLRVPVILICLAVIGFLVLRYGTFGFAR